MGSHLVFITESSRDRVSTCDLVYIPRPDGSDEVVQIADCVWHGPEWCFKYDLACLDDYSHNPKVKQLFQKVLSTQVPDWESTLFELSRIKKHGFPVSHSPVDIYRYLMKGSYTEHDWGIIR